MEYQNKIQMYSETHALYKLIFIIKHERKTALVFQSCNDSEQQAVFKLNTNTLTTMLKISHMKKKIGW